MKDKYSSLIIGLILLAISGFSYGITHDITIVGNTFSPATLQISAGDTVRWINNGGFHNVKADNGSFRCANTCESSPKDGQGGPSSSWTTLEITFNSLGNFNYFCEVHGGIGGTGMSGAIEVMPPPSAITHTIVVSNNTFSPSDLNINSGDYVAFIRTEGAHNVRADDDSFICSNSCLNNGMNLTSGPSSFPWNAYIQFNGSLEVPYYCELHGNAGGVGMSGIIHVKLPERIFLDGFE